MKERISLEKELGNEVYKLKAGWAATRLNFRKYAKMKEVE